MKTLFYTALILFTLNSCITEPPFQIEDVGIVDGLKPIYLTGDWREIRVTDPEPIEHLGKIYYYNGYIFINEILKGIHIFDNTDPENPIRIKFIHIAGNKDISINDGFLYADNFTDLITLDINDLENIHLVSRITDFIPREDFAQYPPSYNGYFECADPDKGLVIGWESAQINNPNCFRP